MEQVIKVLPSEMKWAAGARAEIVIPHDLPHPRGLIDVQEWIEANYLNLSSKRIWLTRVDKIPMELFYTPHNRAICWRNKAQQSTLHNWLSIKPKPTVRERVKSLVSSLFKIQRTQKA